MAIVDDNDILPTARLFWMAHNFRIRLTFEDRYELECIDGYDFPRTLPRNKVKDLRESGDLLIEPNYFDIDGRPAGPGGHVHLLSANTPSQVRRTMVRYTKAKMFDRAYDSGKTVLYESSGVPRKRRRGTHANAVEADIWFKQNEAFIQAACMPFYVLDPKAPTGHAKPRLGQFSLPFLGSVASLKKDRVIINRKGFKITDLVPDDEGLRHGGRKLASDVSEFTLKLMRKVMLRPERMNLAAFRRHVAGEMKLTPALAKRTAPSLGAIRNLFLTLHDASVVAAFFGEKEAVEGRTIYTPGPEYTYPGELVLMDCWKIDLVAKTQEGGGWIFISDPERKEWGIRRRLWVAIVIDACSRAILGLALGFSESSSLTLRAFRMAMTDKSLQWHDAGCEGEPLPLIAADGLGTDIGSSFKNPYFQVAVKSLVPDVDIGPGDAPHLHGIVERVNRTVKDALLGYFTGTTFGNVVAKGAYEAMERASADPQTLGRGLWLWANNVYNLSPHRGLDNQTPYDRFIDRYENRGAKAPYTHSEIRVALGLEFELPLTRQGCGFASNRYYSGRLQTYFSSKGRNLDGTAIKLRAKVDPCDLGHISVFFEGEWHTLQGPPRVRGVGLTGWLDTRQMLARKYGQQREVHAHVVAKALRKLESMGTTARLQAQVADLSYDSEEVKKMVSRIKLRIKEDETPMTPGRILSFDTSVTESSFPATGSEDEDYIETVPDPFVDAGESVRKETDMGLDNVDIDQDGDPIDEVNSDESEGSTSEFEVEEEPPDQASAPTSLFLPKPIRKDQT